MVDNTGNKLSALAATEDKVVVASKKVKPPLNAEAQVAPLSYEPVEGDDENVAKLKETLAAFVKALRRPGTKPEDFRQAANTALQITNKVVEAGNRPEGGEKVFDALLAFFVENIDGLASAESIMKGSTLLSKIDEQRVGYLFAMFTDLARGKVGKINSGQVITVLKSTAVVGYYDAKMANFRQVARSAGQ